MSTMNSSLVNYYVTNKNEFLGEDGHKKLLVGLKKYITNKHEYTQLSLAIWKMPDVQVTIVTEHWVLSTFLYILQTCKKLLFIKYRYSEKAKNSPIYTTIWIDRCNSQHHAQTYRKFYFNEFVANVLHDNMG